MIKRPNQPLALAKEPPLEITEAYKKASRRLFLFDYDGTLVKFAPTPGAARPTTSVMKLLTSLSTDRRNSIVIVSGRDTHTLDNWLGHLPIGISAEHGAFSKDKAGWQTLLKPEPKWKNRV